jgi:hypothetical protein
MGKAGGASFQVASSVPLASFLIPKGHMGIGEHIYLDTNRYILVVCGCKCVWSGTLL